jgi:hypothetical protein
MSRQPQKWSHGNRGAKIFSHVKYELNLFSGTPSNRLLNDKTAQVFMSMFLRSRLRIKLRSLDANGGHLRLFCHLNACLKRFQRVYRADICCEELKLKSRGTS